MINRRKLRKRLGSRVSRRQGTKRGPRAGNKAGFIAGPGARKLRPRPRTQLSKLIDAQRPEVIRAKQRREEAAQRAEREAQANNPE